MENILKNYIVLRRLYTSNLGYKSVIRPRNPLHLRKIAHMQSQEVTEIVAKTRGANLIFSKPLKLKCLSVDAMPSGFDSE